MNKRIGRRRMTQYFYLGAKAPLPTGTFGEKIARVKNNMTYYDTELDAVSINVEHLEDDYTPKPLRLPYKAVVYENIAGSLEFTMNPRTEDIKLVESLYTYILEVLKTSFSIEWYSALSVEGQDHEGILHKRQIYADELTPQSLFIKDQEYVKILRSRTW